MNKRVKETIQRYKVVLQNFSYLTALQLFNIVLPLITYPYLIRILSINIYGTVLFAQAIVMYFSMIINFGFNITATKDVAENQHDNSKLIQIVSSVFTIKLLLWIVTFMILLILLVLIPSLRNEYLLFLLSFGLTFNDFLFPQWFFQGIEKMRYITIINIISKVLFTCFIFIFINKKEDYLLVPLFQAVGAFLSGTVAIYFMVVKEKMSFCTQKREVLKSYFLESVPLFISAASIQIYVNANRILVGSFLGMKDVAYYDLGEKILRLIKIPIGMFGQSTFPLLAREKNISKINKMLKFTLLFTSIIVFFVFLLSDFIISLLGGMEMRAAVPIMRILCFSALMTASSQFLGTSRLIIFGYKKVFTQIIASSGMVFCIGAFVLFITKNISLQSLAWLAVFIEFYGMALLFFACYKKNILR